MSKPSNTIKIKTLLSGLGLEYKSTLVILKVSDTISFKNIILKLRKAEARLKNQRITLKSENIARRINTRGHNLLRTKKKGACFYYSKPRYFK